MKKTDILLATVACVLLVAVYSIATLQTRVQNLEYTLEATTVLDSKQTQAIDTITNLMGDIMGVVVDHDKFIEQQQYLQYEQ